MIYRSLKELTVRQKSGESLGIYAVCSANPFVIQASIRQAIIDDSLLLIEATSNQVDQFGGYTGMKPADFIHFVSTEAAKLGLNRDQLIFGGDHLGPNTWQDLPAEQAMANARELIAEYVKAGFSKIHLDTSMRCQDDPQGALDPAIVAQRAADLCNISEETRNKDAAGPFYVIGTEVPIPGGAHEKLTELVPSSAADVRHTIDLHEKEFKQRGLEQAWERVIAVVAQPGVEFGSDSVVDYHPESAQGLVDLIEGYDSLLYEAHSTDYQLEDALTSLVQDHFAILKVGPQLTYALREAIVALAHIEDELAGMESSFRHSRIRSIINKSMDNDPRYWNKHYSTEQGVRNYEHYFSLSDRIRYYWPAEAIQVALKTLLDNLSQREIPFSLLSQYFPQELEHIRNGSIENHPMALIYNRIQQVLRTYARACNLYQSSAGDLNEI